MIDIKRHEFLAVVQIATGQLQCKSAQRARISPVECIKTRCAEMIGRRIGDRTYIEGCLDELR